MLYQKKKPVKKETYQKSDMVGLPKEYVKEQKKNMKNASTGYPYKETRNGTISSRTPIKQTTKESLSGRQLDRLDRITKKNPERAKRVESRMISRENRMENGPSTRLKKSTMHKKTPLNQVVEKKTKLRSEMTRRELDSVTKVKREEIVRKKDSIANRNASAKGMTREEFKSWQEKNKKKPDAGLDGMQTTEANKRGESKGSCSTGVKNKGESLKDNK